MTVVHATAVTQFQLVSDRRCWMSSIFPRIVINSSLTPILSQFCLPEIRHRSAVANRIPDSGDSENVTRRLGRFGVQAQSKGTSHLEHSRETRIAGLAQRLVQAFATQAGVSCDL